MCLDPDEADWNRTQADYPRELCAHHLFEAQVSRTPDATAVVGVDGQRGDDRTLSYAALNARANRLAHHLIAHGVGPDVRVGVSLDRGPAMVEGVLAVLKAGGAYVALDPDHPEARLRDMLADCAPAVVLVQALRADRWAGLGRSIIAVDRDAAWAGLPATNPDRRGLTPDHLVYVIYTSGSTGRPKGVMNPHRTLVNRIAWARRAWDMTPADAVLGRTPLTFDGSVREIFLPLASGACVVVAPPDSHADPARLIATIRRHRITTVNLVPSLLQWLAADAGLRECTTVRQVLCGGEMLAPALVERLRAQLPRVQLRNLYGPSEAATALTVIDCLDHATGSTVPVGSPIANTQAYVLAGQDGDESDDENEGKNEGKHEDENRYGGEPVPIGVTGELFIGGVGVGRGYVGRPAMTAERFVPDPFSGEPGARLYRTGDRVRRRADGQIEWLGRIDFQVKLRGQRVEPHEVETRLRAHPQVRDAIVTVREPARASPSATEDQRLVAYYVAPSPLGAAALRAHLQEQLPDSMVPAAYVWLAQLPLTPHGKLDRAALPAPADEAYARRAYEPPIDEIEQALAGIWSDVLGIAQIGRRDHFFDLGGHSLMAVQLIARVRESLEVEIALSDLFRRPVLADLAEQIIDAQLAQFDPDDVAALVPLLRRPS